MKETYFKKKIRLLRNVRDFLEGSMTALFFGTALFVDYTFIMTMCLTTFIVLGIIYIYVDCKIKAYKKGLFYYRKRIYSRPIMLHRAA